MAKFNIKNHGQHAQTNPTQPTQPLPPVPVQQPQSTTTSPQFEDQDFISWDAATSRERLRRRYDDAFDVLSELIARAKRRANDAEFEVVSFMGDECRGVLRELEARDLEVVNSGRPAHSHREVEIIDEFDTLEELYAEFFGGVPSFEPEPAPMPTVPSENPTALVPAVRVEESAQIPESPTIQAATNPEPEPTAPEPKPSASQPVQPNIVRVKFAQNKKLNAARIEVSSDQNGKKTQYILTDENFSTGFCCEEDANNAIANGTRLVWAQVYQKSNALDFWGNPVSEKDYTFVMADGHHKTRPYRASNDNN